jgi:hypothetical protein
MNADLRKIHLPLIFTDNADQESHSFQRKIPIPCKIPLMAELKTIRLTEQVKAAG